MSEEELLQKRDALEKRRAELQRRYEELNVKFRASRDEIEAYKVQAEMLNVGRALSGVEEQIQQLDAQLRGLQASPYAKKHESAILAGCLTLERHINELRATLLEGKPPESAGIAGKALPLPPEEAEYAKRMLDELHAEVGSLKERFARGLTDETPSLSLTYMWASVLLGKMEGVVETLRPSRLERTRGEMSPDYKRLLEERLPGIERRIVELRRRYTTARM
ncbi:MAG: hypothetical protein QW057_10085 [Candidatus Bathyarchaeia archaeon]